MISIGEKITTSRPPKAIWPALLELAVVDSCIPGAVLTKSNEKGG